MLKIKVISVGKIKEKFWEDALSEFKKRLTTLCKFEEVVIKEESVDSKDACKKEAQAILKEMDTCDFNVTLEIKGKNLSSEELSSLISKQMVEGKSTIGFVIGSSHGLDQSVMDKSNFALSFSKMTFPHQMFKVMLVEQIYRAFKIMQGGEYHK